MRYKLCLTCVFYGHEIYNSAFTTQHSDPPISEFRRPVMNSRFCIHYVSRWIQCRPYFRNAFCSWRNMLTPQQSLLRSIK